MYIHVAQNQEELGQKAAAHAARLLNESVKEKGSARVVLSTGASQFEMFEALLKLDVDWSKVEMFHLDEYVNLSTEHPASFRKYLKERFVDLVPLKKAHYVNGEGDIEQNIAELTREIRKEPIDVGLIGIGENAHIAFNDPPADFETTVAYKVVNLDHDCKAQQVGEGWFATVDDVPKQAITMSVHQILQCRTIISCVPDARKAKAIQAALEQDVTNVVPASILKTHADWALYLDQESASLVSKDVLAKHSGNDQ